MSSLNHLLIKHFIVALISMNVTVQIFVTSKTVPNVITQMVLITVHVVLVTGMLTQHILEPLLTVPTVKMSMNVPLVITSVI